MNIGILLFEQFYGKQEIGSSRIRGHWIAKHWDSSPLVVAPNETDRTRCEVYRMGAKYDVIIYQKVYWIEHAEKFQGIKILDICDPDFLVWSTRMAQMIELCDAVTTSTEALAEFIRKYTDKPVICIPDRMDLEGFGSMKKEHKGKAKVAGWFGYSENFSMLDTAISSLIRHDFDELIVIASKKMPYQLPPATHGKIMLTNVGWSQETVYRDLLMADVILNPQLATGRWKYKSNNKTVTAWALGLPVASTEAELKLYIDEAPRAEEGNRRYQYVRENYDTRQSVTQLKELIAKIHDTKRVLVTA